MKKFVAVAGNIGVGKSTLVEKLCEKLKWEPYYEPVAENPYLKDFYADMDTWAFHSQVFFLTHRLRSHRDLMEFPASVVQDRSVYEDAEIFARNLYLQGHINERDYATYRKLFDLFITLLPHPDLVVYLRASVETLQARIAQRGRDIEQDYWRLPRPVE
jgi:deoxyadenosine/deoxycytidine kinase